MATANNLKKPSNQMYSFDLSINKMKKESKDLIFFNQVCLNTDKLCESISGQLDTILKPYKEDEFSSEYLRMLYISLEEIKQNFLKASQILKKEIVAPISSFAAQYEQHLSDFILEGNSFFNKISDLKKQADKEKINYFQSSSQSSKASKEMNQLIQLIEQEKCESSELIEKKSSKSFFEK